MKLKAIKKTIVLFAGLATLASCNEEFLDVDGNGIFLEDEYYSNEIEAYAGLTAVYDVVGWETFVGRMAGLNSASDDFYAGGGSSTDTNELQVWSNYTLNPNQGPQGEFWAKAYSGVFRANILLTKLPDVPMSQAKIDRFTAETKALRAYFYFDLVRMFKNIPLITEPVAAADYYTIPQVAPELIFQQIEADLLAAIPVLPATVPANSEGGRMTQAGARALLGKVYLWQNKFTEAAEQLAIVNGTPGTTTQFGNKLLDNYADLWNVDNKFNSESIIEIVHTKGGKWADWGNVAGSEGNILNQMVGPRNYARLDTIAAEDFVPGYGFNPMTEDLFNSFTATDVRRDATVLNLKQLVLDGDANYDPGYMDTGYFLKKFAGRERNRNVGAGAFELNWNQNTYEIRLADTYLMEAEAIVRGGGDVSRAQALLDAVRTRANMPSIPANEENIFKERRLELAGEGHRWYDLVRTGRAATALSTRGFVAGKHEILPIPLLELSNTIIVQNPNY